MKHISLPVTGVMPVTPVQFRRRRKGLFAAILGAIHFSRRAQARRVLKQYQHLIDRADRRRTSPEGGNVHL
ncbi:hypothetical protein ABIB82_004500 [Bradyrhizobium sp. i1.8.4]|uniref:hypothetical protein n=1 Tax=unclassified Bradyrhizobium TaxID=2631580 RepID=UPI003D200A7D